MQPAAPGEAECAQRPLAHVNDPLQEYSVCSKGRKHLRVVQYILLVTLHVLGIVSSGCFVVLEKVQGVRHELLK